MRVRKKPVEVQAWLLGPESYLDIITRIQEAGYRVRKATTNNPEIVAGLYIQTKEGSMLANFGDYVIQGVQREFYPCKADIFEATYDIISEEYIND